MFAVAEIPIDIIPENDENNEDDAAVPPQSKHRRFEDCDFLVHVLITCECIERYVCACVCMNVL